MLNYPKPTQGFPLGKNKYILVAVTSSGILKAKHEPARVSAAQCKKICPERLNWPDRLAGISEGTR